MPGFNNDRMNADGSDVGTFPNTSGDDNSTEFSRSGSDVEAIVNNTSNTADSGASQTCRVEGTSGGNPFFRQVVGTSDSFAQGIDNASASDVFVFTYRDDENASPDNSTNVPWRIDSINPVTGSSRMVVKSQLAISAEGSGIALLDINSSNEATVDARIQFTQQNGTDDARIGYGMSGNNYQWGVDSSDSNSFFLTQAVAGSWPPDATNTIIKSTTAGEVTFPLTPAFLAQLDVTVNNVTGDGTLYTVVYDNEIFDQNSDFDGISTFTAPVTGKYSFNYSITLINILNTMTDAFQNIITSNRTYRSNERDIGVIDTPADDISATMTVLADMDAGDTARTQVLVGGDGLVVDVVGSISPLKTYFSGKLEA